MSNMTVNGTPDQIIYLIKKGAVPNMCNLLTARDPQVFTSYLSSRSPRFLYVLIITSSSPHYLSVLMITSFLICPHYHLVITSFLICPHNHLVITSFLICPHNHLVITSFLICSHYECVRLTPNKTQYSRFKDNYLKT